MYRFAEEVNLIAVSCFCFRFQTVVACMHRCMVGRHSVALIGLLEIKLMQVPAMVILTRKICAEDVPRYNIPF